MCLILSNNKQTVHQRAKRLLNVSREIHSQKYSKMGYNVKIIFFSCFVFLNKNIYKRSLFLYMSGCSDFFFFYFLCKCSGNIDGVRQSGERRSYREEPAESGSLRERSPARRCVDDHDGSKLFSIKITLFKTIILPYFTWKEFLKITQRIHKKNKNKTGPVSVGLEEVNVGKIQRTRIYHQRYYTIYCFWGLLMSWMFFSR